MTSLANVCSLDSQSAIMRILAMQKLEDAALSPSCKGSIEFLTLFSMLEDASARVRNHAVGAIYRVYKYKIAYTHGHHELMFYTLKSIGRDDSDTHVRLLAVLSLELIIGEYADSE